MQTQIIEKNWDRVNNTVIFDDMITALKTKGWVPTKEEVLEAFLYSQELTAVGIYPSEYKGTSMNAFLNLPGFKDIWEGVCQVSQACWQSVKAFSKKCWVFTKNFGKAQRRRDELIDFMKSNPGAFVVAWHPEYRTYQKYIDVCGLDMALQRVEQALQS